MYRKLFVQAFLYRQTCAVARFKKRRINQSSRNGHIKQQNVSYSVLADEGCSPQLKRPVLINV